MIVAKMFVRSFDNYMVSTVCFFFLSTRPVNEYLESLVVRWSKSMLQQFAEKKKNHFPVFG